jgi:hypothetical protein
VPVHLSGCLEALAAKNGHGFQWLPAVHDDLRRSKAVELLEARSHLAAAEPAERVELTAVHAALDDNHAADL